MATVAAVPEWVQPALRTVGDEWPENKEQWQLAITDDGGRCGHSGAFSSVVLEIIRLQIAPALRDPLMFSVLGGPEQTPVVGRHRSGSHFRIAVSVVDLALWDLLAKRHETAPCDLAPSPDASVAAYASAMGFDIHHDLAPSLSAWMTEQGYRAQKWRLSADTSRIHHDLTRVGELGAAAGGADRVLVDGVASWPLAYARTVVPELTALGVGWIEEPVAGGVAELAQFRPHGARLAWGEHAYDLYEQWAALTSGHVDVWQPDVGWCGGLSSALFTAHVARLLGVPVYPHGGSLVAGCVLAAVLGRDAVPAVEYHLTQEPVRQRFTTRPLMPASGLLSLAGAAAASDLEVSSDHAPVDLLLAA